MAKLTHKEKLRLNGIAKFGSEELWREAQRQNGLKGAKTGTGGFYHMKLNDPEKLKQTASKGGVQRHASKEV